MYKNFNLTESEREQILNQHQEKGYKKPLEEQVQTNPQDEMKRLSMEIQRLKKLIAANELELKKRDELDKRVSQIAKGPKKTMEEQDDNTDGGLVVENHIYIPLHSFDVYVSYHPDYESVPVNVRRGDEGQPVFDVDSLYLPKDPTFSSKFGDVEDYINAVKQKIGDNPFDEIGYSGAVLYYETGKAEGF